MDPSKRRVTTRTVGLFGLALVPRLVHLLTVRDSPFFSILYIDPLMYDEWGLRIAAGQLLSEKPFFLDPLYPYFLGAVFAVFGHHFEAVVAIQSLLGALVAPLVYRASRHWFDEGSAAAAGVIAAIYLPSIYFGGLIMKPGLSLFLTALALWMLSNGMAERRKPLHWGVSGVVWGMACLTRGNLLLVVPLLAFWLALRRETEPGTKRRWVEAGSLVAGMLMVLVLPAAHNYAVGGEWILTTANSGANFYIGNNPTNDSGEYQQLPFVAANPKYEQRDFAREAARRSGRAEMTDREISAFWFAESTRWIREQPGAWTRLLWSKVRSFWGAYEIPDSLDYYLYRECAPVLRLPVPGYGLLAPLALLGCVLAWRRPGWPRLLLVFIAAYSASVIVFFVFSRFRMVIAPALFVLAGYAIVELARRWRAVIDGRGGLAPASAFTALFCVLVLFVNLPVRARTDTWSYRLADTVGLPVRAETSSLGHHNLGVAYARDAKAHDDPTRFLELAEAELRQALTLQGVPEHARIHVELAKVLARLRRHADAIEVYRSAAEIEPLDYAIRHGMGILHKREGDLERAAEAYASALRLAPLHTPSATSLGQVLLKLGRNEEAAQAFRHALSVNPGSRVAEEGLRAASGEPVGPE